MLRRVISFVVLLGVLLHAHALVRHNGIMLDAHLQRTALMTDLLAICHPSGSGSVDLADLPNVPRPTDVENDCPLCSGLGPLVAITPPDLTPAYVAFHSTQPAPVLDQRAGPCLRTFIPPARGPPRFA